MAAVARNAHDLYLWEPPRPEKWVPGDVEPERSLPDVWPEDWHKSYPPIYSRRANLEWRIRTQTKCIENPRYAAYVKALCKKNMLYWFAGFCWLNETRSVGDSGSVLPFIPYGYQAKAARRFEASLDNQSDIATPKSRDMGITWLSLLTLQHKWLFFEGFTALLSSRVRDDVDELENPNTLFAKLRFNLKRQPKFLKPAGFDHNAHDKFLLMHNPEHNCSIKGTSTTGDIGRSGRFNVILIDEHGAISKKDQIEIEGSTSDAAASRWYISTPRGDEDMFFKKCHDGQTDRVDLHWSQHPQKGYQAWCGLDFHNGKIIRGKMRSPWYDYEVAKRNQPEWQIAQELDISFSGSGETLLDVNSLRIWRESSPEPIETRWPQYGPNNEPALLIWEKAKQGRSYIVGADPSGGTNDGSYTSVQVFDAVTLEQVAECKGRIGLELLSTVVYILGKEYNWAYLAVEANMGTTVLKDLQSGHLDRAGLNGLPDSRVKRYPDRKIIRHTKPDGELPTKETLGIITSASSKKIMVWSFLEPSVRNQDILIRGKRTISECSGFKEDGIKLRNPDGDDLVMGLNMVLYAHRFLKKPKKNPAPFLAG